MFMMKPEIQKLFEALTCQFLKVNYLNCPQIASPIPILILQMPLPPIPSFTESFKIFSTSQKFCHFSLPATCHLQPCHRPCSTLTPDTCHLTRASLRTHHASPPPHHAQPPTHIAQPPTHTAKPAPHVSWPQPSGSLKAIHCELLLGHPFFDKLIRFC